MDNDLIERLRKRAEIRGQIASRKSVQEGKPDRISEVLLEAADRIAALEAELRDVRRQKAQVEELNYETPGDDGSV